jgi:hypothetical protein
MLVMFTEELDEVFGACETDFFDGMRQGLLFQVAF